MTKNYLNRRIVAQKVILRGKSTVRLATVAVGYASRGCYTNVGTDSRAFMVQMVLTHHGRAVARPYGYGLTWR
jgi:hypothetical protein